MPSISSDRDRLRRSCLLQIQKQGNVKVLNIIILVWWIQSYSPRISTKSFYSRIYQEYEKTNSKTGESLVYSDNPNSFQARAEWLIRINKDEKFHNFLSNGSKTWKMNLSKAPWLGGLFE